MKHHITTIEHREPGSASNGRLRRLARHWMARFNLVLLLAVSVLFLGGFTGRGQVSREYQLKAVFLFNFAQFTEWPTNAFASEKSPLVIGVLGTDPFGHALEETVKGETIEGHPFVIEHYRRADEIKTCHILFISQSESRHMDQIVKELKTKPTLTVADTDGPGSKAVMIRFMLEKNKVHFRINQQAAADAHLVLSSRLLRVAEATPPGGDP